MKKLEYNMAYVRAEFKCGNCEREVTLVVEEIDVEAVSCCPFCSEVITEEDE